MSITEETRRESYLDILRGIKGRQARVYRFLNRSVQGATANELARDMYAHRLVPTPDRNTVHPRLNELVPLRGCDGDREKAL